MKLGFNEATTLGNSNLAKDLELTEKYGYDYIEIRIDKLKEYLNSHSINDLTNFFTTNRVKPYAFNALESITFRDKAQYAAIKEDLRFLCEIGKHINCRNIVVVPSFDVGDKTIKEIKEESRRVLNDLGDIAAKSDIRLAYEFVGYPNCSVNTFGQCYDIIASLGRSDIGMVLDCFHFYAMNSHLNDLRKADVNKIFILHIDDSEDLPAGMLRDHHRVWPGDGVISIETILSILMDKEYQGIASIELFRPEYWKWDAENVIRTGKEKTCTILRKSDSHK